MALTTTDVTILLQIRLDANVEHVPNKNLFQRYFHACLSIPQVACSGCMGLDASGYSGRLEGDELALYWRSD
jgi:hypothetical protein